MDDGVDIMLDLLTTGHILTDIRLFVNRIPRWDEEEKTEKMSLGGGGSAANVAVAASRLGLRTGFIGAFGFDMFGRGLLQELEQEGVDVSHVKVVTKSATGLTLILIDRKGRVKMFGFKGASDSLHPADLDKEYIRSAKHLHITSLSFETATAAAKIAKEGGRIVSFDPGRVMSRFGLKKLRRLLSYVDELFLNREEARCLAGKTDLHDIAMAIVNCGPKVTVIKKGRYGVYAATEREEFSVPCYPVDVVDTTGAGDAFAAGFIIAQIEGKSLEKAVKFGNAAAALKISRVGARAMPTRVEVERFIGKTTEIIVPEYVMAKRIEIDDKLRK